jgi:hypothetical protein
LNPRHESRTEDNRDSKDHFCGPLNKRNDTKISCILSCFLECFVGKTFGCGGAALAGILSVAYLISAKGAAFNASPPQDGFAVASLGHRPRIRGNPKAMSALKARFTSGCDLRNRLLS